MKISIMVTLNKNYVSQLMVLMTSIYINHPGQMFDIYLIHSRIPEGILTCLSKKLKLINCNLITIKADDNIFDTAKVTDRYPKEMYYRLLAAQWLPKELDKILYLDPDILVINPLYELWNTDIEGYLFAAASHIGKLEIANNINKIRLGTKTDYYNSGVLLINLKRARKEIIPGEIFKYVEKRESELILPDQDVLNALYGSKILSVDDAKWNYDARNYNRYLLISGGAQNLSWIMENTSILHFCGKAKPWKKNRKVRFSTLYRHYMNLSERYNNMND